MVEILLRHSGPILSTSRYFQVSNAHFAEALRRIAFTPKYHRRVKLLLVFVHSRNI